MRTTVYIAGKITGEPTERCKMKFEKRKIELFAMGYEPVSPMDINFKEKVLGWDNMTTEAQWYAAMRECIGLLLKCEAINLLPDWEFSRGAQIEWQLATKLGNHTFVEV
jgi:hypothetical protein